MNAFEKLYRSGGVLTLLVTPAADVVTITALGRDEGDGEDEGTATTSVFAVSSGFVEGVLLLLLSDVAGSSADGDEG